MRTTDTRRRMADMAWLNKIDTHVCCPPREDIVDGLVAEGSKWQCDDPACRKVWVVEGSKWDGWTFREAGGNGR